MRIEVDLSDVPLRDVLEPGWYRARVVSGEVRKTKEGEGEYINWELEIISDDENADGVRVWHMTSLPNPGDDRRTARFKKQQLKRFLDACGLDPDVTSFDIEDVVGSELEVQIENEEYEGELRNRVRSFRAAS